METCTKVQKPDFVLSVRKHFKLFFSTHSLPIVLNRQTCPRIA